MAILTAIPSIPQYKWRLALSRQLMEETITATAADPLNPSGLQPIDFLRKESSIVPSNFDFGLPRDQTRIEVASIDKDEVIDGHLYLDITLRANSESTEEQAAEQSSQMSSLRITISGREYAPISRTGYTAIPLRSLSNISVIGVTALENIEYRNFLKPYLNTIRDLLEVDIDEEDLPDSIIEQPGFLRAAELSIYKQLAVTDDAGYDTKVSSNPILEERSRIAVCYQTAALLVHSFEQVIESEIYEEEIRNAQFDIEDKYNFLITRVRTILGDDIVDPESSSGGEIISEAIQRRLYW